MYPTAKVLSGRVQGVCRSLQESAGACRSLQESEQNEGRDTEELFLETGRKAKEKRPLIHHRDDAAKFTSAKTIKWIFFKNKPF